MTHPYDEEERQARVKKLTLLARHLEREADTIFKGQPLEQYAARLTACGFRRRALMLSGYTADDIDPLFQSLWEMRRDTSDDYLKDLKAIKPSNRGRKTTLKKGNATV